MIEGKINLDQFNAFIDLATIGYTIDCLNFTCSGDKIRARLKGIGVFSDVEVDVVGYVNQDTYGVAAPVCS